MAETTIFQLLEKDHREVESMFGQILLGSKSEFSGGADAKSVFEKLSRELTVHMQAEEAVFYTPLQNEPQTRDLIAEGFKEHRESQKTLSEVTSSAGSDSWMTKVEKLKGEIDHHIQDEESKTFPSARLVIDQDRATKMGQQFEQFKQQAKK